MSLGVAAPWDLSLRRKKSSRLSLGGSDPPEAIVNMGYTYFMIMNYN